VNGTFATTTGTFLSGPIASFFTRVTSVAGTGPFGANSLLIGIGWVGQVCCALFCGTGVSGIP